MSGSGLHVSVIVTTYNYARYLPLAVTSALDQQLRTGTTLEVVIVDDGSTDDSAAVARSFGDRVTVLHQPNRGHASAASVGFEASHGDVVIFLDADDMLVPDAVERFGAAFRPGVVHVQGFLEIVTADGAATGQRLPGRVDDLDDLRERVLTSGPGVYVCAPNSGNAWARSFLERVMPLPDTYRGGMEPLLTDTAPIFGDTVGLTGAAVGKYRVHGAGMATARRALTPENIERTLREYEARSHFLAAAVAHRNGGEQTAFPTWLSRNWRLAMLRMLLRAFDGSPRSSFVSDVLCPLTLRRRPAIQLKVAAVLVACWLSPPPVARHLGRRVIRLDYM